MVKALEWPPRQPGQQSTVANQINSFIAGRLNAILSELLVLRPPLRRVRWLGHCLSFPPTL
jgi:hypothetical protein